MYIFYLDDAGSTRNAGEKNLVLGGISVYERHAYWFTSQLDAIASRIDSTNPNNVEFHASEIFSGKTPPWDRFKEKEERIQIIKDVLNVVKRSYGENKVFACVVHKESFPGRDPMEMAFEDLCSRFNRYLSKLYSTSGNRSKGIIVIDESSYETSLQQMASDFRRL